MSEMKNLGERISKLEHAEERTTKAMNELTAELRTIREQFERWRGFVGGMLFVIGAFWTMLQFGFKALVDWGKG